MQLGNGCTSVYSSQNLGQETQTLEFYLGRKKGCCPASITTFLLALQPLLCLQPPWPQNQDLSKAVGWLGPSEVQVRLVRGPGWKCVWNQRSTSEDQFLGPWHPFGGILWPMEAEGRLIRGPGADPLGICAILPYVDLSSRGNATPTGS